MKIELTSKDTAVNDFLKDAFLKKGHVEVFGLDWIVTRMDVEGEQDKPKRTFIISQPSSPF